LLTHLPNRLNVFGGEFCEMRELRFEGGFDFLVFSFTGDLGLTPASALMRLTAISC
jgi:hypothetical protein